MTAHDPYQALRFREFRLYLTAKFCITLYFQILNVVIGWQLYELTHDPLSLGLMGLSAVVPALSVSLYAGYAADRFDRKTISQGAYLSFLVSVLILILFFRDAPYFLKTVGTAPIYFAIVVKGFGRGFLSPAGSGIAAQVVPKAAYLNSASWNSIFWEIGSVVGPVLGGFLCTQGILTTYYIAAALVIIALITTSLLTSKRAVQPEQREPVIASIRQGIRYVFSHQIMLAAISLDLFAVLFGGAVALLPVFAKDILHVGVDGLGFLRAAGSIGAGLSALALTYLPPMRSAGRNLLFVVAGFGAATIAFALSTNYYLSLACLFAIGAFDSVSVVIRSTIMQVFTPDEMRGRVSSVNSMFITSSNELGAFESGTAAALLGTVPSVIFGGCVTLLVVTVAFLKAPILRTLDFTKLHKG
jgi:MFS family permease